MEHNTPQGISTNRRVFDTVYHTILHTDLFSEDGIRSLPRIHAMVYCRDFTEKLPNPILTIFTSLYYFINF